MFRKVAQPPAHACRPIRAELKPALDSATTAIAQASAALEQALPGTKIIDEGVGRPHYYSYSVYSYLNAGTLTHPLVPESMDRLKTACSLSRFAAQKAIGAKELGLTAAAKAVLENCKELENQLTVVATCIEEGLKGAEHHPLNLEERSAFVRPLNASVLKFQFLVQDLKAKLDGAQQRLCSHTEAFEVAGLHQDGFSSASDKGLAVVAASAALSRKAVEAGKGIFDAIDSRNRLFSRGEEKRQLDLGKFDASLSAAHSWLRATGRLIEEATSQPGAELSRYRDALDQMHEVCDRRADDLERIEQRVLDVSAEKAVGVKPQEYGAEEVFDSSFMVTGRPLKAPERVYETLIGPVAEAVDRLEAIVNSGPIQEAAAPVSADALIKQLQAQENAAHEALELQARQAEQQRQEAEKLRSQLAAQQTLTAAQQCADLVVAFVGLEASGPPEAAAATLATAAESLAASLSGSEPPSIGASARQALLAVAPGDIASRVPRYLARAGIAEGSPQWGANLEAAARADAALARIKEALGPGSSGTGFLVLGQV